MKQLARLQRTFQDCVLNPDNALSTAWVSHGGRAAPEIQLSIYTHAYGARLKEVLANDYPAVLMAIGEDRFYRLADGYIRAHPSHYFSLRDFGSHLPGFVGDLISRDADYRDMSWLQELSLFEWTLGQAFNAADSTLFTEQEMAAIPPQAWPELKFRLHPSVLRLDLAWNAPEMWCALTADNPTPVTAVQEVASPWLVWREQLVTRFRSLPADEALTLDALRAGGNFTDLCGALATLLREEGVPLRAAGLLKCWVRQGLISGTE